MLHKAASFPEKSYSEQKALLVVLAVTARGTSVAKWDSFMPWLWKASALINVTSAGHVNMHGAGG